MRSTLDESMLPNFECCMNVWDTQYNHCSIPENNVPNYTISLSGHTPQYGREQSDFMYRLKLYIKNRNIGSFKQPMLGKREVDLYRLFREVTAHGGCENVVKKEGTWSRIYRGMDNYSPTETSASYRLKKMCVMVVEVTHSYTKYLLDYEKEMFNFRCCSASHLADYTLPSRVECKQPTPTTPITPLSYSRSPSVPGSTPSSAWQTQKRVGYSMTPPPSLANPGYYNYYPQMGAQMPQMAGQMPPQMGAQMTGQMAPQMAGQMNGQMTSQMTGQMTSQMTGQMPRQSPYPLPVPQSPMSPMPGPLSPMPGQLSPMPSQLTQPMPYSPMPSMQPMPYDVRNCVPVNAPGYDPSQDGSKRYCSAGNTAPTAGQGNPDAAAQDEGLTALLNFRRSVSPVPPSNESG